MTFLVGWAYDHGRLPSDVLKEQETHPKDYMLLMAYAIYRAEREKKELEEAKRAAKT